MFTTLEIILMIALAYLLIGNIITLIVSRTGIMDTSDMAITIFLWLGIPFIFLYNKLKNIIK